MSEPSDALLQLPTELRSDLKEPLGPVYEDLPALLTRLDGPIIAIGDVVSYHCERAGRSPDVAVIDGRTKRTAVDPEIEDALVEPDLDRLDAVNPAATITRSLLEVLRDALDRSPPVQVIVEGEEDLATLPAILMASADAHVLYGQPDEGVVHVAVDETARERACELLAAMDGDVDRVLELIES